MRLDDFTSLFPRLPGEMPVWHGTVNAEELRTLSEQAQRGGGKLLALWGEERVLSTEPRVPSTQNSELSTQNSALSTQNSALSTQYSIHAALVLAPGMLVLTLPVSSEQPAFPDLSDLFPAANRMQRAVADLLGLHAGGAEDHRKWLRHGAWPGSIHPLRKSFDGSTVFPTEEDNYPFIPVTGNGVHEIPVGPVHAGTIEPGHFRFSIVGERVLRLEERLGYKHKGIEKRFEGMTLEQGARLAGRISGDTTAGYAWAYAQAVESVTNTAPPARAQWLRALFLELERLHNHLGDLGYLGNDAAFAFGFTQFWILKENLLRMNGELFGHRYLMDRIVPGGVAVDLSAELARDLGTVGFVARASGQALDCRVLAPFPPYDRFAPEMTVLASCDVHARAWVRVSEIRDSIRLIREFLATLPEGELCVALPPPGPDASGFAVVEGWRGEIVYWLQSGARGEINRCMIRDPSSVNWLALEQAVLGNIVPDFPLCNKSFNQSYSGHDL